MHDKHGSRDDSLIYLPRKFYFLFFAHVFALFVLRIFCIKASTRAPIFMCVHTKLHTFRSHSHNMTHILSFFFQPCARYGTVSAHTFQRFTRIRGEGLILRGLSHEEVGVCNELRFISRN